MERRAWCEGGRCLGGLQAGGSHPSDGGPPLHGGRHLHVLQPNVFAEGARTQRVQLLRLVAAVLRLAAAAHGDGGVFAVHAARPPYGALRPPLLLLLLALLQLLILLLLLVLLFSGLLFPFLHLLPLRLLGTAHCT